MNKTIFSRLGALLLTLAMLAPCVLCAPADAAQEDYEVLYSWAAKDHTLDDNIRLIQNNSMPRASYEVDPNKTQANSNNTPTYTMRTAEGTQRKKFFGMLINGGTSGGLNSVKVGTSRRTTETLRLEFTGIKKAGIIPQGYGAMAMTWLLAMRVDTDSDLSIEENCIYTMYTNKGQSWSVGNRCWKLVGTGEVEGQRILYYQFTSEDLMPKDIEFAKNEWVNKVVLEPTGKLTNRFTGRFMFTDVEIRGYESKETFEREFPGKTYTPVSEETLRSIVIAEAEKMSEITYTLDVDAFVEHASGQSTAGAAKTREYYPAGITYYGPIYQRKNLMSTEALLDKIKDGKLTGGFTDVITPGTDCSSYAYNAMSRVSRTAAWTNRLWQRDPWLYFLGDIKTTDAFPLFTDADIMAANDANTMYEAYALAKSGDGLNRIFSNGGSVHARLVHKDAVVVRNADGTIDPNKSYLPCIEQTSGQTWFIQMADGSQQSLQTTDYALVQNTVRANPGSRLVGMTCTPRKDYTFAKLFKDGYIPYTVAEYRDEQVENVRPSFLMLNVDGHSPAGGVELLAASSYRIISHEVVLEDLEHGTVLYDDLEYMGNKDYYCVPDCTKLNEVLQGLSAGSYRLTLITTTGPVTAVGGQVPTSQRSVEFTVDGERSKTAATLNLDADVLTAAQEVTVDVNLGHAFESADAEIKFDTDALTFVGGELTAKCTIGQVKADIGIVRIACAGAASKGELARLIFRANRDVAKTADVLFIKNIKTSTADSALASDMTRDALEGKVSASLAMGDVYATAWYADAVDYALDNQLMSGYNATTFGPNDDLSRAMVVQILYNREGKPALTAGHPFPDVTGSDWYNGAVAWASANKVVDGYGDGRFGPNDNVTLEQIAVILWNYAGSPAGTGSAASLGTHSDWAANALAWAATEGLFDGVPYTSLTGTATRAQTAQMLMNFLSK